MPRIGEYELLETIASGAFGKVKMVKHMPTNTFFAAKIIPKTNRDVEKDIRVEIRVMRRLKHDHVIRLNEILESQNNYYIILEPARGGDLCDMVMANPKGLTEEKSASTFLQILSGLKACHESKVAHRDLKPENILFTDKGVVKITDFGLSRLHQASPYDGTNAAELANTLTGTPQYVAPDVLKGPYDAFKADLWSLGCILYVMLTSRFPFGSAQGKDLEKRILAGTYEKLPDSVSADARSLVDALLKKNPDERLPLDEIPHHPFLKKFKAESYQADFNKTICLDEVKGDDFREATLEGEGSPTTKPKRKLPGA